MPKNLSLIGRWWQKVDVRDPHECWPWTASRDKNGYGKFQYPTDAGQVHVRAHRWIYEQLVGPVPEGMQVCHSCDHPWCVNPAHLWLGTNMENDADKRAKGRAPLIWGTPLKRSRQIHCLNGHELAGENLYITPDGYRSCKECGRARSLRSYHLARRAESA